jgi:hypothetical protein
MHDEGATPAMPGPFEEVRRSMPRISCAARSLVVATVAVGALSLASAGAAAASPAAPGTPTVSATAGTNLATTPAAKAATRQYLCSRASKALSHFQARESAIAAELPKLTAAAQLATKGGHTHRAKRLYTEIARLHKVSFKTRIYRASTRIRHQCGAAPVVR